MLASGPLHFTFYKLNPEGMFLFVAVCVVLIGAGIFWFLGRKE